MDIGQRLLSLLRSHNMTQKSLALQAELTPSYVNQICAGKKIPTIETLEKICGILSIPLEEFFIHPTANNSLSLDPNEYSLITLYRNLPQYEKIAVLSLVRTLAEQDESDR